MNFKKTNTVAGWIICAIACTVYILTREATVSFWDCGEFIPCADKLQISHPPGAPLFILLGRLFIILFGGGWDGAAANPHAASQVNLLSAMSSGFTILFLFWTITHLGRKLLVKNGESITMEKTIAIIGAGAVGALAFTFSDSFWFSAVEGIVFGVSPLFISMAFWAILKWEEQADQPGADRWIVFIAYVIGLSIGVHLLSLLSIPAIVMTYYFRKYRYSMKSMLIAFGVACMLTGVVQFLVIQDTVKLIGWFELLFTNDMGLPFNTGSYFCLALFVFLIAWGIRWGVKKGRYFLQLGLLCFAFILIGYSTYFVIMIRANAEPAVNMQNVNNPIELVNYLDRSQYGSWPIIKGADFTAKPTGTRETGNIYFKNDKTGKYDVVGKKVEYDYDPADIHFFPRLWDADNTQGHVDYYKQFLGLGNDEPPATADNIKWLFAYQFNWMYWRYLMWNYSGRQNDLQGMLGNPRDGNWVSGIPVIDNFRLGDQSRMPASLKQNKAHTELFMLPFLLAILGALFQWKQDKKGWVTVFLLFFFTGTAIILYLNQAGPQPRERDYSMVGSFYAFAIWIGLGVLYVYDLLKRKLGGTQSAMLASGICLLAVPARMCAQEWKAHDRSMKTLARDSAADYLNSCAPNAILFTGGDNDTYPLWYDQEVENIRPDVRVIVTSLLGSDWDINQLRRKVNESAPIPISWTQDKYLGDNRNYVPYYDKGDIAKDSFLNLNKAMLMIGDDSSKLETQSGESINYLPTHNFYIPVDKQKVLANGTVAARDSAAIVSQVRFTVPGNAVFKGELMQLNIAAANNWDRPIYYSQLFTPGFNDYLKQDGLAYRFEPVNPGEDASNPYAGRTNMDIMYNNLMTKFKFGGADKPNVYFDENGRRSLLSIRRSFAALAMALAANGKKDSALQALNYADKMIQPSTLPYGMVSTENGIHNISSLQTIYAYYMAGDSKKAGLLADQVARDCNDQLAYYNSLSSDGQAYFMRDQQEAAALIKQLQEMNRQFTQPALPPASLTAPGGK
ncbi:MAG: DUF2723 domain-containing protein [Puia sp.]|nr:DUF2723 domain-containing protein [Puia sp.]